MIIYSYDMYNLITITKLFFFICRAYLDLIYSLLMNISVKLNSNKINENIGG